MSIIKGWKRGKLNDSWENRSGNYLSIHFVMPDDMMMVYLFTKNKKKKLVGKHKNLVDARKIAIKYMKKHPRG